MHPRGRSRARPRPEIGDAGTVSGADAAGARPTRGLRIAPATQAQVPTILDMIRGLARFERLAHLCIATEEDLHRELFSASPSAEVILAWEDGEAAGFALF